MLTTIHDYVLGILPGKRKKTPSGWISFNAPCCHHNGENPDTRSRGGVTANSDGSVSYHCFNCGYKASYQPGRHLTFKFRKLLNWLGADDADVKRLVIEAIRVRELISPEEIKQEDAEPIVFTPRPLPEGTVSFEEIKTFLSLTDDSYNLTENLPGIGHKIEYVHERFVNLEKYKFYVTDSTEHSLHQRVIIPFTWQGKIIGWTARTVVDGIKPKYYTDCDAGYVFNVDKQQKDWKFVIVCEGPFDAMSIDGVAVLGSECSEQQAEIIEGLGREVIVVPDKDKAGNKLISDAIEYGWSVSFPLWYETCKDINEAVIRYGKLFVLKSILEAKETSRLKIELLRKKS